MGKKILYAFLVVMLIINAVLLYLIIDKKMSHGPSKGQTFLTEQLNFSEAQKDAFFTLDEEHRGKMIRMDEELKDLRELLFRSFDKEQSFVDTLTMKMGELETEKFDELFTFFGKVRALCDEKQAKEFDQIIQEVLKRRGPKGKPNRPPPPH
jgi:hypothetical protein